MPLITEEQGEKREGTFLKYETDNILEIRSNLYKIESHYIKSQNTFASCKGEECAICKGNVSKHTEYNYFVSLNGSEGVMNIKPSVFFNMNAIEKASKKSKRDISWLVIKTGSGLETEYTVSKNENLEDTISDEKLKDNNERLANLMKQKEAQLEESYKNIVESKIDGKPKEDVNPDDVPF